MKKVQLLEDANKENHFYYIPNSVSLSKTPDSLYEFVFWRYINKDGEQEGLLHFLVEFDLRGVSIKSLEKELKERIQDARLIGRIPLTPTNRNSFSIVSSIINSGEVKNISTSQSLDFREDGKAVVAIRLNEFGTSLLWQSFQQNTSDVNILINCSYAARSKNYNFEIKIAFEDFRNQYSGKSNLATSEIESELKPVILNSIKIPFKSYNLEEDKFLKKQADDLASIMVERVLELYFKRTSSSTYLFSPINSVIDTMHFDFTRSITLNIPVQISGNINLSSVKTDRESYLITLDQRDPSFERKKIFFQLGDDFTTAFKDDLNQIRVKAFLAGKGELFAKDLYFDQNTINQETFPQLEFGRGDLLGENWDEVKYQSYWYFRGAADPIVFPNDSTWLSTNNLYVLLDSPVEKRTVTIISLPSKHKNKNVEACIIKFKGLLGNSDEVLKEVLIDASEIGNINKIDLFYNKNTTIKYEIVWLTNEGDIPEQYAPLIKNIILLNPTF